MPSVVSNNTPTPTNNFARQDNNLYRCMITKVCYTDDPLNVTSNAPNPNVLYEATVLGGFFEGQLLSNISLASWLGGQFNYAERTLRAASRPLNEVPLSEQDGDIVYIQFIQGDRLAPVIIGLGTQPLDGDGTGAATADGPLWVEQFNGVETRIDNMGNYSVIRKGGTLEEGVFTPNETEADYTGQISLSDEDLILRNGDYTAVITSNDITISNMDGDSIVIGSGNVEIKNAGGLTITLGSSGLSITGAGNTSIQADMISLDAGMVNVGEGAGFHSTIFENLKTEFEAHVHLVPQSPGGVLPSQKPLIPLTPTVGSQSVTIAD